MGGATTKPGVRQQQHDDSGGDKNPFSVSMHCVLDSFVPDKELPSGLHEINIGDNQRRREAVQGRKSELIGTDVHNV
jgi:hypothetical protein